MSEPFVIAALYQFAAVADPPALRDELFELCDALGIGGTLLVANEGLNGTLCGNRAAIDALLTRLREQPGFADLEHKESEAAEAPFHRLKVRLKKEIVTMGVEGIDPTKQVGTYVEAEQWNELLNDPQVVLVDTRNDYEVRIGSFEGAVDPKLESFRDFPRWASESLDPAKTPKVAMFCTGGIRCEKASALLLERGFEEVFHLHGGILKYLERVPEPQSKWQGECFVFDQRVSVDHRLAPGTHALCFGCQEPVSVSEQRDPRFEAGVTCGRCFDSTPDPLKEKRRERMRQVELAQARGDRHIGTKF